MAWQQGTEGSVAGKITLRAIEPFVRIDSIFQLRVTAVGHGQGNTIPRTRSTICRYHETLCPLLVFQTRYRVSRFSLSVYGVRILRGAKAWVRVKSLLGETRHPHVSHMLLPLP